MRNDLALIFPQSLHVDHNERANMMSIRAIIFES